MRKLAEIVAATVLCGEVSLGAAVVLAAALRCRASLEEVVAWQSGAASGVLSESVALAAKDGPLPPLPHLRPGSLPLARAALVRPLSALSGTNVHEVYVLAPMASTEPDHPLQPHLRIERRLRQLITRLLLRQAKALSAEGKRVTIVTPGPRDLAVMGANLMDPAAGRTCRKSLSAPRPTRWPRSTGSLRLRALPDRPGSPQADVALQAQVAQFLVQVRARMVRARRHGHGGARRTAARIAG